MRKNLFVLAALALVAGSASAQTASVALDLATHNTAAGHTGTASDAAFRGLFTTRQTPTRFIYQDRIKSSAVRMTALKAV